MKDSTNERPFGAVMQWIGIALFVFTCISGYFPSAVNWGMHFWGFLPSFVVLVLAALYLLALVPKVQTDVMGFFGRTGHRIQGLTPPRRWGVWCGAAVFAGILFWVLRQGTHFLGDGYLLLRTLPLAAQSGDIPASFPTAPLTGFLAVQTYRLFLALGAAEPALLSWQSLSMVSGILALPIGWSLAGLLWSDVRERISAFLLLVFSGSAMLFFGYVETYPPAFTGLLLYVMMAMGVQQGKRPLVLATLAFVLMCLLHVGMVILIPSLAYLFVRQVRAHGWRSLIVPPVAGAGLLVVAMFILSYSPSRLFATFVRDGASFVPLSAPDPWGAAFSLFSLWHLADLINVFLLVSPLSIVLVGGFLAAAFLPARFRPADAVFWIMLAVPSLLWLFLNNFELGLSRDWDLASPFVYVVALAGVVSWSVLVGPSEARRRGLVIMTLLTLVQTAGWVAVNSSVGSSVLRFESLLDFRFQSQRAVAIALEELGGYRRGRNDFQGAAEAYSQCVVLDSTNARRWMLLAGAAASAGNTAAARSAYERAVRLHVGDPDAYLNLGILLFNEGDVKGGIRMVQDAVARDTTNVVSTFALGRMYQDGARDPEAALAWFARTLQLDSGHAEARARSVECLHSLTTQGSGPQGNHRSTP